nr:unnamed protein product [Callosobruchus analis]
MIIPKRLLYPEKEENSSTVSGQKFEEKSETFTKTMIPAELARKRKVLPFWAVPQNVKDRDTCLCEIHVNFHFLISKLKFYSIIKESSSSEITEGTPLLMSLSWISCETIEHLINWTRSFISAISARTAAFVSCSALAGCMANFKYYDRTATGRVFAHANNKNYQKEIQKFILMYNVTPHGTTGKSPSQFLFGRNIRDKIPSIDDLVKTDIDEEARDK